jgi:uncharacterized protein (DUF1501 family)
LNRNSQLSRRHLLRTALGAAALSALPARAAGSGSRALVCIYLFGGIDSNNVLVPMAQYDAYAAARGALAIPKDSLVQVTSGLDQTVYGFHPALAGVAGLFSRNALAVAGNVGSSTPPTTPDPYLSYFPPGYAVPGWAARMAGVTEANRNGLLASFPALLPGPNATTGLSLVAPGISASAGLQSAVQQVASRASSSLGRTFPATGLGQQLAQAAELINAGGALGMDCQVFLCSLSGPGTLANPLADQAAMLQQLNDAMTAFYAATLDMGLSGNVTTYTDSEFSRTLQAGEDGSTPPAWGSHQLVMGGAVLGGSVYGGFGPSTAIAQPRGGKTRLAWSGANTKRNYLATLGRWAGLSNAEILEYLGGPAGDLQTLGFMVTG